MKEVGAVLDMIGGVLYWHEPDGSTGGSLPDSTKLWDVIWSAFKRGQFAGFAHSHPGSGWPSPSNTDITTFRAIEQALGVLPTWWICSADRLVALRYTNNLPSSNTHSYHTANIAPGLGEGVLAPWAEELRRRSGYATARDRMQQLMCPPGFLCIHDVKCPGAI